jgi:hypothetical protein
MTTNEQINVLIAVEVLIVLVFVSVVVFVRACGAANEYLTLCLFQTKVIEFFFHIIFIQEN